LTTTLVFFKSNVGEPNTTSDFLETDVVLNSQYQFLEKSTLSVNHNIDFSKNQCWFIHIFLFCVIAYYTTLII